MTMASRIAVMSEGRLLQVGAPDQIYETPANRFVADFIGNVNLMDGRLIAGGADHALIDTADGRHRVEPGIEAPAGTTVTVAVRPEKIRLSRSAPESNDHEAGTPVNQVHGTVRDLAYFGSFTVYHLALPSGSMLKVSQGNTERLRAAPLTWGDEAWASWSPQSQVVLTA